MSAKTFLFVFILLTVPLAYSAGASERANSQANPVETTAKPYNAKSEKYPGYSMDGVTSASKLAAQRSHTVAGEDERNFAIFTGVVMISIVVFVTQIVMNKK